MNSASDGFKNFDQDLTIVKEGEMLVIKRRESGKMYRGKFKPSNRLEEFTEQCSFQPMSGRETLQLPEGDRMKSHVKIYSAFAMKRDDIVERNGESYEVQLVNNWGTYTKSIARLVDVERS